MGGYWSAESTWVNGVPAPGDSVIIADGAIVYLDEDSNVESIVVGSSDNSAGVALIIQDGVSLTVNSCTVRNGGGWGPPKVIYVGSIDPITSVKGTGMNSVLNISGNLFIKGLANPNAGVELIGSSQLKIAGNIVLPNNYGFLTATDMDLASVTLNGATQQVYMRHGTAIEYPNLVVDGSSVTIVGNTGGQPGYVGGDLIVKNGGVFNNSGRQLKVDKDIFVEEGANFHLSGGSTITVDNETKFTLYGKLITEHVNGLAGVSPLDGIDFGENAEIEFAGSLAQKTGFADFYFIDIYPKLIFNNKNITNLDDSIVVKDIEIKSGATFNGNGHNYDIIVTNSWLNNGTFAGNTSTVRFEQNVTSIQGTGVNNFRHLALGQDVHITDPVSLTINGNLTLEEGSSLIGDQSITVVGNIGVGPGAEFTAPETLTVGGNLIVDPNGEFRHDNGRVVFQGPLSRTSGVGTFYDVTATGAVFQGQDTIVHELSLLGPTTSFVENSASLVLDLDKGYVDPASTSSITGITFIKDVQRSGNSYLSFPLPTAVVELKNMGFKSVHNYSESRVSAYASMGNSEAIPVEGKGYALVLNNSSATIELTGNYNAGASDVSVNLTSTYKNGELVSGRTSWNLIGNPYPFELDWDELRSDFPFVYESIYISSGEKFLPYVGDVPANGGTIPAMQAFMVYLRRLGYDRQESFVLRKTAGLRDAPRSLYRKAPVFNVLKLEVANGGLTDATYVRLTDEATTDFDSDKDAMKLKNSGTTPSFYSYLLGNNYAINSVPATFSKFSLPLAFEAKVAGSYTITLSEEYVYDLPYEIYLEDKVLNILHPIGLERNYTFFSNLNEAVGRFILHFENPVVTAMKEASTNFVRVFSTGNDITVQGLEVEQGAEVALYDIAGRVIAHYSDVDLVNKSFTFTSLDRAGMYIVNVVSGERSHSERVVLY